MQQNVDIQRGANWFYWVGGLSLVNTALYFLNLGVVFPIGLGIGQLLTYLIDEGSSVVLIVAGLLYVISIGIFLASGFFASKGMRVFFIIGIATYVIDSLIIVGFMLLAGELALIIDLGFHVFVLVFMIKGALAAFRE